MANSGFALGNFLEFLFPNIFDLQLVESTDAESSDKVSHLYLILSQPQLHISLHLI